MKNDIIEKINNARMYYAMYNISNPTHVLLGENQVNELYKSSDALQYLQKHDNGKDTLFGMILLHVRTLNYLAVGFNKEFTFED